MSHSLQHARWQAVFFFNHICGHSKGGTLSPPEMLTLVHPKIIMWNPRSPRYTCLRTTTTPPLRGSSNKKPSADPRVRISYEQHRARQSPTREKKSPPSLASSVTKRPDQGGQGGPDTQNKQNKLCTKNKDPPLACRYHHAP